MNEPETVANLNIKNLSVEFGMTQALSNINFEANPGEIIGLVGHNGAGKTTLFNVISGVLSATSGVITIVEEKIPSNLNPKRANELGIVTVHQEPALALNLSVLENLVLGQSLKTHKGEERLRARQALDSVGGEQIELETPVDHLTLAERQILSLARGMFGSDIKLLLLDEPTASLGEKDTEALHQLIKKLAHNGVTVIYVSHRLPDIFDVCSRITVLRSGKIVEDGGIEEYTPERLMDALAPGLTAVEFTETQVGEVAIRVSQRYGLEFRKGEVVGLYGMAAGEHFKLVENFAGLRQEETFNFLGQENTSFSSPAEAIKHSVYFVPGDRDKEGLIGSLEAGQNIMLPWVATTDTKGFYIHESMFSTNYFFAKKKLNIFGPGSKSPISLFSGGNRQKVLLARWMYPQHPDVIILNQPTQGVDIGAKADIVRSVRELASKNTCIVVVSSEADEIASMCDRAYVVHGDSSIHINRTESFGEKLLSALLDLGKRVEQPHQG